MTTCGETSEVKAAALHGAIAGLYILAVVFHIKSIFVHRRRNRMRPGDENWAALGELIDPKDRERWLKEILAKYPKLADKLKRA